MQAARLNQFDPATFEHFVNELALEVLGAGTTGFAPGADGGRDGWFEGKAPYPSAVDCWEGVWYLQSKFHAPHLTHDAQKWLVEQVKAELAAFQAQNTARRWPDNWIVATNVDPSAVPNVGTFDQCRALVAAANPKLASNFAIWGGTKLLQFAGKFKRVAKRHAHLLTAGDVLSAVMSTLEGDRASKALVIDTLVARGLTEHQHTKLDQAGSLDDQRPGIHHLYVDLPYKAIGQEIEGRVLEALCCTSGRNHRASLIRGSSEAWGRWERSPRRARIWFVRGGPGQGKSTIGQFYCQIQRAALWAAMEPRRSDLKPLAEAIRERAELAGLWPLAPRVPIYVELKKYSQWFGERRQPQPVGVESYLAEVLTGATQQAVTVGALRAMFAAGRWAVVFDGLDEVPAPVKDSLADEIREFVHGTSEGADMLTICTSRPQGYSGQFESLQGADVHLVPLPKGIAFECARRVAGMGRTDAEQKASEEILLKALKSEAVGELMTSPLQAHIMAVIVRSGQHPPERKWELYRRFYDVILAREAGKGFELLRREGVLIKSVHNKLGFVLHCDAEHAEGSLASLPKGTFEQLVGSVVREKRGEDVPELTERIMVASTERLVLINTPEKGTVVRFDIRQIQEFFAAEFLYDGATPDQLAQRVAALGADAHWREVFHFMLSALAENNRKSDLSVVLKVLESIDDSHVAPDERDLARALGRGAVLSAALLRDGVLEQDHGVRNLFWKSLEPLVAARDEQAVESLMHVEGEASRRWIVGLMVSEFESRLPSQVVGAFRVLWQLVRDGDPEAVRIRAKLRASNFVPLEVGVLRMAFEDDVPFARWHAEVIVDALSHPESGSWWAIAAACRSVKFVKDLTEEVVRRHGESWSCLPELYLNSRSRDEWKTVGPFRVASSTSRKVPAMPEDSVDLPRALRILIKAAAYANSGSRAELVELLELVNEDWMSVQILPPDMMPIGEGGILPGLRRRVAEMEEQEFQAKRLEWSVPQMTLGWSAPHFREQGDLAASLREILRDFPGAFASALRYLSGSSYQQPEVAELVKERFREDPTILGTMDPRIWGYVVEDRDRTLLREACRRTDPWRMDPFRAGPAAPFALHLPDDAVLLPRVLSCVADHRHYHRSRLEEKVEQLLELFELNAARLNAVALQSNCGQSERVAAILLTLLCRDSSVADVLEEHAAFLLQAAVDGNQIVHELGRCGALVNGLALAPFRVLVSSVLHHVHESGDGAATWDGVIEDWRQRSASPSLTLGARDAWCNWTGSS